MERKIEEKVAEVSRYRDRGPICPSWPGMAPNLTLKSSNPGNLSVWRTLSSPFFCFLLGNCSPTICGLDGAVSYKALLFQLLRAGHVHQTWPIIIPYGPATDWFWSRHESKSWTFLLHLVGKAVFLPLESMKCKLGSVGYIFLAGREILSAAGKESRVKQI